jgi:RNA polymerase sigma-70 factor (ECF subfamily)
VNGGYEHGSKTPTNWNQWLERHTPGLLLYARQQARYEADAQDLVQEAVLEFWRRDRVDPPPAARVFSTIRCRAIDQARSQDRRAARERQESPPDFWFDTRPEEKERTQLLHQAMTRMPVIYREVVTLKIWGELTFAEIGETLQIPANTAASRYRYGLEELRRVTREVLV